jgi:hypothetical protein
MPFTVPLERLGRWMRRTTRRPPRALEPADMGTCFGMEQWLDQADSQPAPLPVLSAAAGQRRPWWAPRWAQRALRH